MSFNFVYEIAVSLGKQNSSNLATLYLLKYCLSELARVRKEVEGRENIIRHEDWINFVGTSEFANSFQIIDNLLGNVKNAF